MLYGCTWARFGASARARRWSTTSMRRGVEAAAVCRPLHRQFHYEDRHGCLRGQPADTERIADRALALPLHGGLDDDRSRTSSRR